MMTAYRVALGAFDVTTSTDLTPQQARAFRITLQRAADAARRASTQYCTPAMLSRLRFHAIPCGIEYCDDLGSWQLDSGAIISGQELRQWLRDQWALGQTRRAQGMFEPTIPSAMMNRLYEGWINPKANEWLEAAGYRRPGGNAKKLFARELLAMPCDHLIDRFRAMHEALERRSMDATPPPDAGASHAEEVRNDIQ